MKKKYNYFYLQKANKYYYDYSDLLKSISSPIY